MKKYALVLLLAAITAAGWGCATPNESKPVLLKGATLYDGNGGTIEDSRILIEGGRIIAVGSKDMQVPDHAEVIDLTGKFITPGLVDAHVHFSQTGFFDGRPDALDIRDTLPFTEVQARQKQMPNRYWESYLRAGVTAVYDVGGFEWIMAMAQTADSNLNAPHIAASGPLLTPFPQERLDVFNVLPDRQMLALNSPEKARELVNRHHELGATGIKIWTINLKDSVFIQSLRAAAEEVRNVKNQLIVHATNLDEAKLAIRLGAKVLVHSVDDKPLDAEFLTMAKDSGVVYCPTLVVVPGYTVAYKSLTNPFPLNDPNNIVDAETRKLLMASEVFYKYYPDTSQYAAILAKEAADNERLKQMMYGNLKAAHQAGISIALSTDAGNPGTLHGLSIYDELEAMQAAGLPAADIITMATRNGAKAMRRQNDFGVLEAGKMADLIVLDKDPAANASNFRSITHVMRGGLLREVNKPF